MAQTQDGWTISTVDQDGRYAYEEVGKVWLKNPHTRGATQWRWFAFGSVAAARTAARKAQGMTFDEFEAFFDAQINEA